MSAPCPQTSAKDDDAGGAPPRMPTRMPSPQFLRRGIWNLARVKDGTKLYEAIEAKLGEQRRFMLWWDEQGLNRPGSPILVDRRGLKAGEDGIPNSDAISRWRKRLKDPRKFDEALALAADHLYSALLSPGFPPSKI